MIYRELKRVWSNGYPTYSFMTKFKEKFPELSKIDSEELKVRFSELNMDFYCEKETRVNGFIRLTLPFAMACIFLMFMTLPITFMITGRWSFPVGEGSKTHNWFKALKIA